MLEKDELKASGNTLEVHYELTHTTEVLNHDSSYSLLFLKEKSEIHLQHYGPNLVPMDLYIVFLPLFLSEKMSPFPYEEICNSCSSAERHGTLCKLQTFISLSKYTLLLECMLPGVRI